MNISSFSSIFHVFIPFSTILFICPISHLLKTLNKKLVPSQKLDFGVNCAGLLLVPDQYQESGKLGTYMKSIKFSGTHFMFFTHFLHIFTYFSLFSILYQKCTRNLVLWVDISNIPSFLIYFHPIRKINLDHVTWIVQSQPEKLTFSDCLGNNCK